MLGGMIAIGGVSAPGARWLREILCAAGVALIVWSVLAYSSETKFPGEAAIAPCLGAALLIFAGEGPSVTSAVLASPPLRAIGLISYSLYLWHWVILVFAKYALFRDLDTTETIIAIALSFAAATASWRFVELPFRDRKNFTRRRIFVLGLVTSLIGIGAGALFDFTKGLPQRYPAHIRAMLAVERDRDYPKADGCLDKPIRFDKDSTECRFGDPRAAHASFALWGDLHAGMIRPVLAEAAIARHIAGYHAEHFSCPPGLSVASNRSPGCREFNAAIAKKIVADPNIRDVILMADWAKSVVGTPFGNDESGDVFLSDAQSSGNVSLAQNRVVFARGLDRLIAMLTKAGKHVDIVASTPEMGWPVPETLARIALSGSAVDIRPTLATYLARQKPVFDIFAEMQRRYGVTIIYPHKILCAGWRCRVMLDGEPIYRDSHHLIYRGVELLHPALDPLLER